MADPVIQLLHTKTSQIYWGVSNRNGRLNGVVNIPITLYTVPVFSRPLEHHPQHFPGMVCEHIVNGLAIGGADFVGDQVFDR